MQTNTTEREIRVRTAPSPTGDPHVGTAYNALFNYAFAKANGGKFILRIEDTDRQRSTRQSEERILSSLKWLGLQWDEGPDIGGQCGPYRQSERSEHYRKNTENLLNSGNAYRCFCTKERLAELRAAQQKEKQNYGYDGHCRNLSANEVQENLDKGLSFVVRLKIPETGKTVFKDALRDEIVFENQTLQDHILMKADGFPTYHLANVVDDHLMQISHVIRAEEWISSTPLHVLIYQAFGWEPPVFVHLPLLRNPDKSKMSKRKNPVSITYYQRQGFLPETLLNFLALQGWSLPNDEEIFSLEKMVENFTLDRISLGGPIFDLKKLLRFNGIYIRNLDPDALKRRLTEVSIQRQLSKLGDSEYVKQVISLFHNRLQRLSEFDAKTHFMFMGALPYNVRNMIPKGKNLNQTKKVLFKLLETYQSLEKWSSENLEQETRQFCEDVKWTTKEFFMFLRIIITGSAESPPLFETMVVLGQDECLARIQDGAAALMLA